MICSDPICEFHLQLLIHWELLYFRVFRCVSKTRTFSNNFRRFLSIHVIKIYVAEFSNISKAQIASRCQLYSRDGLISDALKNINHIDFFKFSAFSDIHSSFNQNFETTKWQFSSFKLPNRFWYSSCINTQDQNTLQGSRWRRANPEILIFSRLHKFIFSTNPKYRI